MTDRHKVYYVHECLFVSHWLNFTHDVEWLMETLFFNGLRLFLSVILLVQCLLISARSVSICLGTTYVHVIINYLHRLHSTMQGFVDVNLDNYWATNSTDHM